LPDTRSEIDTSLSDIITLEEPLGPHATEKLVGKGQAVFRSLYDDTNGVHLEAQTDEPHFVVGRKGAGKTAFLLGTAFAQEKTDVSLIRSEDIYTEVNKLLLRYEKANGAVAADRLAHVWEVLLFHAAMHAIVRSDDLPNSEALRNLWNYMSAFGRPDEIETDDLLAAVGAEMTEALLVAESGKSFRHDCWSIRPGQKSFGEAVVWTREILEGANGHTIFVVVDNLEDLHAHLDAFSPVIIALFRLVGRNAAGDGREFPFKMRFAFPAELLEHLNDLAANAEKDFVDRQTIRWTAQELIAIVGHRLRIFLNLHFPSAPRKLGLPQQHDARDAEAAAATLRALLPDEMINRLQGKEDPVAYLMRHTQLLPRHLILMLNHVMRNAVAGLEPGDVPRVSPAGLLKGVSEAETVILSGILSSYSYQYPHVKKALRTIKNRVAVVDDTSRVHQAFNESGTAKKTGLDFDDFLDACLGIGAFGIVTKEGPGLRYTEGNFSYTFANGIRGVESEDRVCVHPLFVPLLFDRHRIKKMATVGYAAVYPYGSDPLHVDYQV